ncbi:MAG: hypothetical protein JNL76_07715 [Alphaproteobacteria bacterium]|nr:hypothetical protein [Alphaproteobacteria bacterium]
MNFKSKKLWFIIPFLYLLGMNFLLYLVKVNMAAEDSSAWLGFPLPAYVFGGGGLCIGIGMCPPKFYPIFALADSVIAIVWPYAIYLLKTKQLHFVFRWCIYLSIVPIFLVSIFYLRAFYGAWY